MVKDTLDWYKINLLF